MRLSLFEIQNILKCTKDIFGEDSKVYLFGSRVDGSAKGGDIDLYIEPQSTDNIFEKKIKFLAQLDNLIGEQKVDLVVSSNSHKEIELEAKTKGIKLDIEEIKLEKYFNECDRHIQRINEAYEDMKSFIPLNAKKYQNLNKDQVQDIDQYLFRFAKLQDTMGDKIFKSIIRRYENSNEPHTFIDILNKLEKYRFIENTKEWINLRKIRNTISHQYDDEPEEMAEAINNIVNKKETIEDIYSTIKKRYREVFE